MFMKRAGSGEETWNSSEYVNYDVKIFLVKSDDLMTRYKILSHSLLNVSQPTSPHPIIV